MKTLPNYLRLLAIAVTVVTLGSCSDDDDYYWSPLIGDWVLVADEYGPVDTDQNIFSFYADGQEWVYRWAVNGNNMYLTDLDTGSQLVFAMY